MANDRRHSEIVRHLDTSRMLDTTRRIITHSQHSRTDWIGPSCILALSIIGVFYIYSAQAFVGGDFWIKQIVWIVLGSVVYTVVSRIDYKIYLENALFFYLISIILLLMLFLSSLGLPLLGVSREGAWRWLDFGFINYQPSEAAKVCALIMISSVLARSELGTIRQSLWIIVKVIFLAALPMFLIFLQPDLGSCLIIPPLMLSLLYISKLSQRFFVLVLGLAVVAVGLVSLDLYHYVNHLEQSGKTAHKARGEYQQISWFPLQDYQRERIMTFVAPEIVDPRGTGAAWNSNQAQQAVGTGGLWGKGWQEGLQARLGYLPRSVAHNDFIFAVLAEESGFIGGILVIGIFTILLANGVRVAGMARDRFGVLLAIGVTVIFLIHVFINIGMTIGLTPITGLPLPFLSYGGSFILSCCILQGIIQSVHRHRRLIS